MIADNRTTQTMWLENRHWNRAMNKTALYSNTQHLSVSIAN